MTTTNTNNFSVKALIAKYRNFVKENCKKQISNSVNVDPNGHIYDINVSTPKSEYDFHPDRQLITYLYLYVTGKDTDKEVEEIMSDYAKIYHHEALNEDETRYLCNHFAETAEELIRHGKSLGFGPEDWREWGESDDPHDIFSKEERLQLIKKIIQPKENETVFFCNSGCDVAELFPNSKVEGKFSGVVDDGLKEQVDYALAKIWAFSKKLDVDLGIAWEATEGPDEYGVCEADSVSPLTNNNSIDYIVYGANDNHFDFSAISSLYDALSPTGKMLIFTSFEDMACKEGDVFDFKKRIVEDKALASIISYEENSTFFQVKNHEILLVIDKSLHHNVNVISGINNLDTIIPFDTLEANLLWPGYYLADKPQDGISLSSIADIEILKEAIDSSFVENFKIKMEMPIPTLSNFSTEYKDANLYNKIKKMKLFKDPQFDDVRSFIHQLRQPCVLLYGNGEIMGGYFLSIPDSGICSFRQIACIVPKEGIDVRYLCALLLSPTMSKQINVLCDNKVGTYTLSTVFDKIIVPNHKDSERLRYLSEANYDALVSTQNELKQELQDYNKAVRMRKHALTQSISAIQSSFETLNLFRKRNKGIIRDNDRVSRILKTSVSDLFESISQTLKDLMPVIDHIADVEYTFGKPEWIDPEQFIREYIAKNKSGWLNFSPDTSLLLANKADGNLIDPATQKILIKNGEAIHKLYFSKKALERVFDNIVSNAISHGFTSEGREDYKLRFTWKIMDNMLQIIIENNGTHIPEDREPSELLKFGVSMALHQNGHNGIGCDEINQIMQKYEGNVRIVSEPNDEFAVKYILTFQTNNYNTLNYEKP